MTHENFNFPYDRLKLLTKVRENRDHHVATYEEAWVGYLVELEENLTRVAAEVRASIKLLKGRPDDKVPEDLRLSFNAHSQPPTNHSDEYDRVIDMLEFTNLETVTLTQDEFNQYVRDEWSWSQQFTSSTTNYLSKVNTR